MAKKFVAIVGMVGAGKTTAANYLAKKSFNYLRFGQVVMDELEKRKLNVCEKNERAVREGLRQKHGMAVMAKLNYTRIKKALQKTSVSGDGLYSWAEYLYLKEKLKEKMVVLALYASPKIRYQRTTGRQERALSAKLARSRDYADIENIQKAGPIAMADYTIINEGTVKKLQQSLDQFLKQFHL